MSDLRERETLAARIHARSWLFAPGDSERKMEKAAGGAADIVLLDLEDSVAATEKAKAREQVSAFVKSHAFLRAPSFTDAETSTLPPSEVSAGKSRTRERLWVRINSLAGPEGLADLAAVIPAQPGGILLPKVRGRADAEALHHYLSALEAAAGLPLGGTKVMLLLGETPESLFSMGNFTGLARLASVSWGAEDLATALGASGSRRAEGRFEFTYELARSLCLLSASAAGVPAIETIQPDFRDSGALDRQAQDARRAGFSGMLAIHPDQVDVINGVFAPTAEELSAAQAIVVGGGEERDEGFPRRDGVMLDRPHLIRAQAILARSPTRR